MCRPRDGGRCEEEAARCAPGNMQRLHLLADAGPLVLRLKVRVRQVPDAGDADLRRRQDSGSPVLQAVTRLDSHDDGVFDGSRCVGGRLCIIAPLSHPIKQAG